MGAALSAWVGSEVAGQLRDYCKQHGGYAIGDGASYRCYDDDPNRVRIPDASFISSGRLDGGEIPSGYLTIPPDLAVEVVSPSDRYGDVEDKAEEYLEAGVVVVWVINPSNRSVRIFRRDTRPEQLGPNDELTAEEIMPGFRCRVAELFPNTTAEKRAEK